MNWSRLIRQTHRWLGVTLIALTLANMVAFGMGQQIAWLVYLPLAPLFLLMLSGLYMFVQPYFGRRRVAAGR